MCCHLLLVFIPTPSPLVKPCFFENEHYLLAPPNPKQKALFELSNVARVANHPFQRRCVMANMKEQIDQHYELVGIAPVASMNTYDEMFREFSCDNKEACREACREAGKKKKSFCFNLILRKIALPSAKNIKTESTTTTESPGSWFSLCPLHSLILGKFCPSHSHWRRNPKDPEVVKTSIGQKLW